MDKTDLIIKKIDALAESTDKKIDAFAELTGKRFSVIERQLHELADVVLFIKNKMVTKDELKSEVGRLEHKIESEVGKLEHKIDNLIDNEVDKRKGLEVRVTKLEEKVF